MSSASGQARAISPGVQAVLRGRLYSVIVSASPTAVAASSD